MRRYYHFADSTQARPVFQEEALLFDTDRDIAHASSDAGVLSLKARRAKLWASFILKLGKYYGMV